MAELAKAFVEIEARSDKLKSGLDTAKADTQSATKSMVGSFVAVGAAIAAAFAVNVVKDFAAASIEAFNVQAEAEAKLSAVIKATGEAAGKTAEQLFEEAAALQSLTMFGDEAIINTQALIATFKNIKGDEFTRVTAAAADMATVMGTDLKSAAIQLGKALNDPDTQLSALSRSGVTFSETQKQMVKDMVAAGDQAGAQQLILAELESQFGGAAEAAADTFGGSVQQVSNLLGDMQEDIGAAIAEGLLPMVQALKDNAEELKIWAGLIADASGGIVQFGKDFASVIFGITTKTQQFTKDFKRESEIRIKLAKIEAGGIEGFFASGFKSREQALAELHNELNALEEKRKAIVEQRSEETTQKLIEDQDKLTDATIKASTKRTDAVLDDLLTTTNFATDGLETMTASTQDELANQEGIYEGYFDDLADKYGDNTEKQKGELDIQKRDVDGFLIDVDSAFGTEFGPTGNLINLFGQTTGLMTGGWEGTLGTILGLTSTTMPQITAAFQIVSAFMDTQLFQDMTQAFQHIMDEIAKIAQQAADAIKGTFSGITDGIRDTVSGAVEDVKGFLEKPFGRQGATAPRRFADGGVINAPTFFGMKGGQGLMGEAGPEAILPLQRDSRGRLGVSGGGGVNVNITVQGSFVGNEASFQRFAEDIGVRIKDKISQGALPAFV